LERLPTFQGRCLVGKHFRWRASTVHASGSKTSPSSPENVVLLALKPFGLQVAQAAGSLSFPPRKGLVKLGTLRALLRTEQRTGEV
jgi:hypothetical protein